MSSENHIHVLSRGVILDTGHILLCKTLDLPINFYFLPGGHIEHGESAEASVLRELQEEAGLVCTVKRFLGCLEHSFEPGHNSICHNHEYNLIFELAAEGVNALTPIPQCEEHIALTWAPLSSLNEIDFRPEPFKTILPEWLRSPHNGDFRSVMRCR